jgi:hypothetical protein
MAVTVPNNAIVTFASIEKVLVVQNGKALREPITTGRRNASSRNCGRRNVGEKVILEPGNLQTGQDVQVID